MMRQSASSTLKLPRKLLEELGTSEHDYNGFRKKRHGLANRKGQRKAARMQKKSSHAPAHVAQTLRHKTGRKHRRFIENDEELPRSPIIVKTTSVQSEPLKSILKAPKAGPQEREAKQDVRSHSPVSTSRKPRGVQEQSAADDAEIEALEKALGIKGKKKLPKSFEDDGLDDLLDGIDDVAGLNEIGTAKRKRDENEEWLKRKREKAKSSRSVVEQAVDNEKPDAEEGITESDDGIEFDEPSGTDEDDDSASLKAGDEIEQPSFHAKTKRENPYIVPITISDSPSVGKYIPPSLRSKSLGGSEIQTRLRRQIQGLLNRLSEANLTSILVDLEGIYRDHPRQYVSSTLLDLLLGLLSDPTSLQDTFIILHAGFIAAVCKVLGSEFGAQVIQRVHEEFFVNYNSTKDQETSANKKMINLTSLLVELYNFRVIGDKLIYDFVRLFLQDLSETNSELLLKIVRNAGIQLRQDDPSSLKDIVIQLQKVVAEKGETSLSVRTKFMVETMNNLKNNRMKTGVTASMITSEHTIRMKKILGSFNQQNIRASEPLRVGLKDLQDSNKRGKWWLVGASYKGDTGDNDGQKQIPPLDQNQELDELGETDLAGDLVQLAKEQRMNTDVRRSIFIAIVSSSDFNDAYVRLMKLGLKKNQELEIPKIVIHCAGAEKVYNPFYASLSRRVCSDKKLKMAFQFSLWDLFKRMEEREDEVGEDRDDDTDGKLSLRTIVNLARLFGVLVAEGGLTLGVLKVNTFLHTIPVSSRSC